MLTSLLAALHSSGYVILWLAAFIGALGVPIPMAPVLLAAGAFSAEGTFNVWVLAADIITATIAGNCLSYELGRRWGSRLLLGLPRVRIVGHFITAEMVARSRDLFHRHASWTLILTRTVLSSLGTVVNLVAGTELYPFQRFLFWDALGEGVGILSKLLLGYLVGASWRAAGDLLGLLSLSGVLIAVVGGIALIGHRLLRDLTAARTERTRPTLQGSTVQQGPQTGAPQPRVRASNVDSARLAAYSQRSPRRARSRSRGSQARMKRSAVKY